MCFFRGGWNLSTFLLFFSLFFFYDGEMYYLLALEKETFLNKYSGESFVKIKTLIHFLKNGKWTLVFLYKFFFFIFLFLSKHLIDWFNK